MMTNNRMDNIMPKKTASLIALIPMLLLFCIWNTQPVCADEPRPCSEEITKFCKDIRPGGGRIILCLKNHENELTPVCKDKIQAIVKRVENAKQLCANDIEKFCKGVQEGEGRIARCLGEHATEISAACREQIEWVKAKTTGK